MIVLFVLLCVWCSWSWVLSVFSIVPLLGKPGDGKPVAVRGLSQKCHYDRATTRARGNGVVIAVVVNSSGKPQHRLNVRLSFV